MTSPAGLTRGSGAAKSAGLFQVVLPGLDPRILGRAHSAHAVSGQEIVLRAVWANLLTALLLSVCATSSASAKDYHGPDFTAHLPAATFCMDKAPAPDHGFVALLRSDDCGHADRLERLELI